LSICTNSQNLVAALEFWLLAITGIVENKEFAGFQELSAPLSYPLSRLLHCLLEVKVMGVFDKIIEGGGDIIAGISDIAGGVGDIIVGVGDVVVETSQTLGEIASNVLEGTSNVLEGASNTLEGASNFIEDVAQGHDNPLEVQNDSGSEDYSSGFIADPNMELS